MKPIKFFPLKLFILIFIFLLSISACGSRSENQNNSGDDQGQQEDQEEEFVSPVPLSLTEMVYGGVDNGNWTEGEGLALALNYLLGTAELPNSVDAPNGIDSQSVWGLSNMIAKFLQSDAPENEKAEVERLSKIIAPRDANLEAYAVPAGTSQSKPPGLALANNLQITCTDLWASGFPTDTVIPLTCLEYEDGVSWGSYRARAYYPAGLNAETLPMVLSAASDSLAAVEQAVNTFQGMGLDVRSINIIFTLQNVIGDAYAYVPGGRSDDDILDEPCPILVLPLAVQVLGIDQFMQVIAHEVYHCVQFWRYGSLNTRTTAWWAESAAVYFSDVVFPEANQEFIYIGQFDVLSPNTELVKFDIRYGDFLFFMYVGQMRGPTGVLHITDGFTNRYGGGGTESSQSSQLQKLSAVSGIDELFHQFGQAYLDHELVDSRGALIPVNPNPGRVYRYPNETPQKPEARPFVLSRYQILFSEEHEYQVSITTEGADGQYSVKPSQSGNEWGEMPETISAACGDAVYPFLITNTNSDSNNHYRVLDVDDEESLECDDCLVGHWEMSALQYESYISSTFNTPNSEFESMTGTFALDIYEDGSYIQYPVDYSVRLKAFGNGVTVEQEIQITGYTAGHYGINDEDRITGTVDSDIRVGTVTITMAGNTFVEPFELNSTGDIMAVGPRDSTYTCNATTFSFDTQPEAPFPQVIYQRISNEPNPKPDAEGGGASSP